MDQHLGVSIDTLVKLMISVLYFVNINMMRYYKTWFGFSSNDKITEVAIVHLDIALACPERQPLDKILLVDAVGSLI